MRVIIALLVLSAGCSAPPSKPPVDNSTPNNVNASTNNQNITPNNQNVTPNLNNRPFVDPNDFDRSCEWDSECELVVAGDICGCTLCGDAIADAALDEFNAVVDGIDCSGFDPVDCPAIACETQIAVCSAGTCTAIPFREVFAESFDQSCEIDADCVLIATGGICSDCDCGRGAINVDAYDDYLLATGDPDCTPGPMVCDCAPADTARCDAGTCVATFGG